MMYPAWVICRALVAVTAAAAASACTTFHANGDAPDAGPDAAATGEACWMPWKPCADRQICCVAADGSSACADALACPDGHGQIACRSPADCAGGQLCCATSSAVDAGSATYAVHALCSPGACTHLQRACAATTDCVAPEPFCHSYPDLVPPRFGICEMTP
jgi:hypothetical protein